MLDERFNFPILGLYNLHTPEEMKLNAVIGFGEATPNLLLDNYRKNVAWIKPSDFENGFPYPISSFDVGIDLVTRKLGLNLGHRMSMYANEKWLNNYQKLGDFADFTLLRFFFLPKMKGDLTTTIGNMADAFRTPQNV